MTHDRPSKASKNLQRWIHEAHSEIDESDFVTLTELEIMFPPISARRRNLASKNIEKWKRRLSDDPHLLQSLTDDADPHNADRLFDLDISHACNEFGLDVSNVKHRNLLLGIFCESYFPAGRGLPGFLRNHRRGRPGIDNARLWTHARTLNQIIKRRGMRAVMIEACEMPRDVILRQKISDERRAVLLQKFWPEYYAAYSEEVIIRHLSRIKNTD
jgi:hypothetical protein